VDSMSDGMARNLGGQAIGDVMVRHGLKAHDHRGRFDESAYA